MVKEDLINAGYSGGLEDAASGMLSLFRIHLSTPAHVTDFPIELTLVVDFNKDEQQRTIEVEMISEDLNGVYQFRNSATVHAKLRDVSREIGPRRGFTDKPTNIRLSKLLGFNPHSAIEGLSPIEGAMLLHHVYIGSFRVVSGWQWAGRPIGLHESQQLGFVQ